MIELIDKVEVVFLATRHVQGYADAVFDVAVPIHVDITPVLIGIEVNVAISARGIKVDFHSRLIESRERAVVVQPRRI